MKKISAKALCRAAIIASLYFAISILLLPYSAFGPFQIRVAESLTMLSVISPLGIIGVTLGCAITNTYGIAAGFNILGAADVFLGTSATLIAGVLSWKLRKIRFHNLPILATLPPILINAVVVGCELSYAMLNTLRTPELFIFIFQVAFGQTISCGILGILLVRALEKINIEI